MRIFDLLSVMDTSVTPENTNTEYGVRVQFRCEIIVRRRVNCPELESDPIFFTSAGRSFTRYASCKIPLHFEGVARSDGVVAGVKFTTPPAGHPFMTKGN